MRGREVIKREGYRFYRLKGSGCVSVWSSEGFIEEIYTHAPLENVVQIFLNNRKPSKKRKGLWAYIAYALGFSDDE